MFMRKYKAVLRGKRGSSLPMVLAIGLVLVIWVMALTPIITAQGKASIDVQNQEAAYLQSRSAIEFTKGELVNMVSYGNPRTFAVVKGKDAAEPDQFTAIDKRDDPNYAALYVNNQFNVTGLNSDDYPLDSPEGDKVVAICAVDKSDKIYDINITTYCNGKGNLTYHTTYTPPVASKMINPEAYKKTQALPLSDFVLVDGKYGNTVAWNSTLITSGEASPHTSPNYITKIDNRFSSYSANFHETFLPVTGGVFQGDAKNLPAVFKKTVETPADPNASKNMPDTVRFEDSAQPTVSIKWAEVSDDGITITLNVELQSSATTALYCCTNASGVVVNWQSRKDFNIPNPSGCYTFYCYVPQHISADGKTIYNESEISEGATLSVYTPTDFTPVTPIASGQYMMYTGSSGNPSYFLKMNKSGNLYKTATRTQVYYDGAPVWTVDSNSNKAHIIASIPAIGLQQQLTFSNVGLGAPPPGKYSLITNGAELTISNNTIKVTGSYWLFGWRDQDYYLDIVGTDFCSTSQKNTYFAAITPPALTLSPAPEKPAPITLDLDLPDEDHITVDTTLDKIKRDLESQCAARYSTTSTKAYIVLKDGDFVVYISGYKDGRYFFTKVGTVALKARGYGVAGAELYFMGKDAAVAADNPIYIKADLLVIRDNVATGDAPVYVTSYNEDYGTLVFFVKGTGPFEAYNFYKLGNNKEDAIDLTSVSAEQATEWLVRDDAGSRFADGAIVDDSSGVVTSIEFPERVLELENSGKFRYPVINFDIAYASDEQLAHVVSGEASRWTSDGVLQGSSNDLNSMYVVCPYITSVNGDVTRSANRILTYSGTRDLAVASTVKFYTRYLSFDTDTITKGDTNAHFYLYSLTKQPQWDDSIKAALGSVNYSSQTLQVDFECSMTLVLSGTNKPLIDPQICRYDSGADLFAGAVMRPLQASYTTDEIENALLSIVPTITIIDRYVDISGSSLTLYNFVFGFIPFEADMNLYSNYVSFDSSIEKLYVPSNFRDGLMIGSQETGYTSNEYLFLFKYSTAEEYNGTLIHFESDVKVYAGVSYHHTIDAGFYAVPSGETRNILDFNNPESAKYVAKLDDDDLLKYSSVIKEDGSMDSAYVDTGFETDASVTGGFGGGTVNK